MKDKLSRYLLVCAVLAIQAPAAQADREFYVPPCTDSNPNNPLCRHQATQQEIHAARQAQAVQRGGVLGRYAGISGKSVAHSVLKRKDEEQKANKAHTNSGTQNQQGQAPAGTTKPAGH